MSQAQRAVDPFDGTRQPRVPKAAELVAGELRRKIVSGELGEGDTLPPEAELIQYFGVSRPTLREAIRVLESEGLIKLRRGQRSGAVVQRPTVEQASLHAALLFQINQVSLGEIIDAWLLIEPKVVAAVAANHTNRTMSAIRRKLDEDETLIGEPIPAGGVRFHEVLRESQETSALGILHALLQRVVEKHFDAAKEARRPIATHARYSRAVHDEHTRLVELIETGDAGAVEEAWRAHLTHFSNEFRKEFGSRPVVVLP